MSYCHFTGWILLAFSPGSEKLGPSRNGWMERNFPVIPILRNFRPTTRGTPKISEWNSGNCLFHSLPNPEIPEFLAEWKAPQVSGCTRHVVSGDTERKNGWLVDGKWRQWVGFSFCDCAHQLHVKDFKNFRRRGNTNNTNRIQRLKGYNTFRLIAYPNRKTSFNSCFIQKDHRYP